MTRRSEFARLLPVLVAAADDRSGIHLQALYDAIECDHPHLVDDEVEATTGAVRWKHELRWELETLVGHGDVKRRKDLGRAMYSL